MPERSDDVALVALADHLDYGLARRLRELVDADSAAQEIVALRFRTQRAEDLAAEIRRQMAAQERQLERLRQRDPDA